MSIHSNTLDHVNVHTCTDTPPTFGTLSGALVCSDTAWSIPCCVAVSASISVEAPLSAAVAPVWELDDDGTEGRSEGED